MRCMITEDKIIAIITIVLGILILSLGILPVLRNALNGKKTLDGKVIGINYDDQSLRIRYKINRDTYQDIDYYKKSCFLSGNIPKIGLKVTVTVHKDDLYSPVSVFMATKYAPFTKIGYLNDSRSLTLLRFVGLSSFLIIGGILLLIGVF